MTAARRDAPWIFGPAEPEHRPGLLPAALAEVTADGIRFGCTLAEFSKLGPAQEAHVGPGGSAALPGGVAVRRGQRVRAAGRDIGRAQGVVIDRASHQVTHILLREGLRRGRRDLAIPISAVAGIEDDAVRLRITRQEVRNLPGRRS
jgi:hypothetical protein